MNDTELWLANDRLREARRSARLSPGRPSHRGSSRLLRRVRGQR